jgi:hypothetical protein
MYISMPEFSSFVYKSLQRRKCHYLVALKKRVVCLPKHLVLITRIVLNSLALASI